jgi:hypothetical protein
VVSRFVYIFCRGCSDERAAELTGELHDFGGVLYERSRCLTCGRVESFAVQHATPFRPGEVNADEPVRFGR